MKEIEIIKSLLFFLEVFLIIKFKRIKKFNNNVKNLKD